jgi:hypothetical protein
MLGIHPTIQGAIGVAAFVLVTLVLWIAFARSGSRHDA